MERYIGMDVHAVSCTLAVISDTGRNDLRRELALRLPQPVRNLLTSAKPKLPLFEICSNAPLARRGADQQSRAAGSPRRSMFSCSRSCCSRIP
jgi:hypothetical protein